MTSVFLNSPHLDFDTYWITSDRPNGANTPAIRKAIDGLSDTFSRRITIVPIDDSWFDGFVAPAQKQARNQEQKSSTPIQKLVAGHLRSLD